MKSTKSISFVINSIIGIIQIGLLIFLVFSINDLNKEVRKTSRMITGISTPAPTGSERVEISDNPDAPFLGSDSAKVKMIVFSDFQCGYCKTLAIETLPRLKEEYVEKGLLQISFRNLPLPIHEEAFMAAEAASCANDQGKFWEMHDILFDNMHLLNAEFFYKSATSLDLNKENFEECLKNRRYKEHVEDDMKVASQAGITGTPTVIINGSVVLGSMPYDHFKELIDRELQLN